MNNEFINENENSNEEAMRRAAESLEGGVSSEDALAQGVGQAQNTMNMVEQLANEGKQDLGKVDIARKNNPYHDFAQGSELMGWMPFDISAIPSAGKFYPHGAKLLVRAAKAKEIRFFSTMDEANIFDINDKLNEILRMCVKIELEGGRKLQYKDICEEDRLPLVLLVRQITFPEPENKLLLKGKTERGEEGDIELSFENLKFSDVEERIEKYYDDSKRAYVMQTKNYGEIEMRPPSIGVMEVVLDYIKEKEQNKVSYDKSWLQVFPYITFDWRGLDTKKIFDSEVKSNGWDSNKFSLHYRLAEKIKIGVKPEVSVFDDERSAEVTAELDFPGGIKGLFIISDIFGELL